MDMEILMNLAVLKSAQFTNMSEKSQRRLELIRMKPKLNYTVLYCTVLYCIVLYYTMLLL